FPCSSFRRSSVAPARIGHHVLSAGIAVIAAAVREPVPFARCSCRAGETADHGARGGTAGAAGYQTAEHTTDDGAAHACRARIGRRRWRRVSNRRRPIGAGDRCRTGVAVGDIVHIILGDISRRTVKALRIEVPDATDIPPPAHPAVVNLVMPPAAFPGEMTAI